MSIFKTDKKLGFGLMRLPVKEDKSIDVESLKDMVDLYMQRGFNYFDTAYNYHNGACETAIREALVERYPRESYTLADKMPAWVIRPDKSLVEKVFEEQLEKTGAGYFDYYLLHSVVLPHIPVYEGHGCWEFGLKMKEKGKIRHFGFSFHDRADVLDELLTKHSYVDFVQLQLNYLDWENDIIQSRACYEVATRHNKPIVVMEPVRGGELAALPPEIAKELKTREPERSEASWALRFVASLENVKMVLSGMTTAEQMEDNLQTFEQFKPLTEEEHRMLLAAAEEMLKKPTVPCTACSYCTAGCPMNIPIPECFKYLNNTKKFGKSLQASVFYRDAVKDGNPASACIECGQCEGVCPQHINIIECLKETAEVFDK